MPLSKVSNVKTFYDYGALENNVKVKLTLAIKGLAIVNLGYKYQVYLKWLMNGNLSNPLVIMGKLNFDP